MGENVSDTKVRRYFCENFGDDLKKKSLFTYSNSEKRFLVKKTQNKWVKMCKIQKLEGIFLKS